MKQLLFIERPSNSFQTFQRYIQRLAFTYNTGTYYVCTNRCVLTLYTHTFIPL
jgi:hypothetical protein